MSYWKDQFTDENNRPITIQFKDRKGLKLVITKLKQHLISN